MEVIVYVEEILDFLEIILMLPYFGRTTGGSDRRIISIRMVPSKYPLLAFCAWLHELVLRSQVQPGDTFASHLFYESD